MAKRRTKAKVGDVVFFRTAGRETKADLVAYIGPYSDGKSDEWWAWVDKFSRMGKVAVGQFWKLEKK